MTVHSRTKAVKIPLKDYVSWLETKPWIASASLLEGVSLCSGTRLELRLTPEGHDQLRDAGWAEFERELWKGISSDAKAYPRIDFSPQDGASEITSVLDGSGTFPRLLSSLVKPDHCRMLIYVDPGMCWFKGHFPGRAILPGVVQLHWAVSVSHSLFSTNTPPRAVNRLKFQKVVVPPRVIELKL